MGAGHLHRLHRPGDSVVHTLPPQVKLVALFTFVIVVVLTPREQMWAFGLYAALILGVVLLAGLSPLLVLKRMAVEIPFVIFAVLLPFIAEGPTTEVAGLTLSSRGCGAPGTSSSRVRWALRRPSSWQRQPIRVHYCLALSG